jgi:serine/threonine protein kinase/tetratricopeptide (TPR) repeat protein
MAARWHAGGTPLAEEYLDRHPELWLRPDPALELIAEELALRAEHGHPLSRTELARRFPRWGPQVETLWRCQHEFGDRPDERTHPGPGATLGEFRLLSELGRGANGTVFLARQSALVGRTVVLKLAPAAGGEHLSLARLQHNAIVPLYSAHEFPEHGLRGLCLPYFGRATLAALLASFAEVPGPMRTGACLLSVLEEIESGSPVPLPVRGPACDALRRSTFVDAICRIGAALADALAYAHSRGLVHLDVKPSNVLIAADGEPMLLDFHLARAPLGAGATPAGLGGTREYMAPEHAAAVDAVRRGEPLPAAVGPRADLYSLGRLLTEALGPDVPVGLGDVLARCTAPNPDVRYADAAALAADLRRHLADLPFRGVPNRSLSERWHKWRRRRPLALPTALIGTAVALFGLGTAVHFNRQVARASDALSTGEAHTQHGRFAEGAEALRGGEAVLRGVPLSGALRGRLHAARLSAERAQAAADLHQFCERVRPLFAAEVFSPAEARAAANRCAAVWAERQQIAARLAGQPAPELERQWRADLLDVGILSAHLRARLAPASGTGAAHREALAVLDEAESLLGPSGVLDQERAEHARALGLTALADSADRRARAIPPRTAWEHLVAGRASFAAGDAERAGAAFDRCLELDPASLWGNNYRGLCRLRSRDPAGAAAAFSACVALAPQTAWCFAHRALAETQCGSLDRAVADFNRALALDPNCAAALVGRSTVLARTGHCADALADLDRARSAGVPPATVSYHIAACHLESGNRPEAVTALRECLAADPAHAEARAALVRLDAEP